MAVAGAALAEPLAAGAAGAGGAAGETAAESASFDAERAALRAEQARTGARAQPGAAKRLFYGPSQTAPGRVMTRQAAPARSASRGQDRIDVDMGKILFALAAALVTLESVSTLVGARFNWSLRGSMQKGPQPLPNYVPLYHPAAAAPAPSPPPSTGAATAGAIPGVVTV